MRRTAKGVIREEQDDLISGLEALRQLPGKFGRSRRSGTGQDAPRGLRSSGASALRRESPDRLERLVVAVSTAGMIAGRLAAASKPLPGSVRRLGVVAARMMLCAFEAGYYNRSTYFSVRSFRALIHTEFFHADTELDRVEESANGQ